MCTCVIYIPNWHGLGLHWNSYFCPTGALELVIHEKSCGDPSMCGAHGTRSMFGANFTYDTFCCSTDLCNTASAGLSIFQGLSLFPLLSIIPVSFLWGLHPPNHLVRRYTAMWDHPPPMATSFPADPLAHTAFASVHRLPLSSPFFIVPFSCNTFKAPICGWKIKNSLIDDSNWIYIWGEGKHWSRPRINFSAPLKPSCLFCFIILFDSPLQLFTVKIWTTLSLGQDLCLYFLLLCKAGRIDFIFATSTLIDIRRSVSKNTESDVN